jgi:hypothetical protein
MIYTPHSALKVCITLKIQMSIIYATDYHIYTI